MQALPPRPPGAPPPSLNKPPGPPPPSSGVPPGPPRGPPGTPLQPSVIGSPPPRPAMPLALLNSLRKPDDPSNNAAIPPTRAPPGPPLSTARPPGPPPLVVNNPGPPPSSARPPGPPGPPPLLANNPGPPPSTVRPPGPPGPPLQVANNPGPPPSTIRPPGPPGPPLLVASKPPGPPGPPPAGPQAPAINTSPPNVTLGPPPPRGPPGPPPHHLTSSPDLSRLPGPPPVITGPQPPRATAAPPPGPPALPPVKLDGATANMFDALKEKATKMSELRQSGTAPATAPPSQRSSGIGSSSSDSIKGFNTDMLKRAMVLNNEKNDAQKADPADDDSDGGWSDDDKPVKAPLPAAPVATSTASSSTGSVLSAGERLPSGVVIKKSMSKPPEVSRPPPTRPMSISPSATVVDAANNSNTPLNHSSNDNNGASSQAIIEDNVEDGVFRAPEPLTDLSASLVMGPPTEKEGEEGVRGVEACDFTERGRTESKCSDSDIGKKGDLDFEVARKLDNATEPKLTSKASAQRALAREGDSGMQASPAPLDRIGLNKIALLQEEVANLKKALSRAESRLIEVDKIGGNMKRELEIEKELEDMYRKAYKLKLEKQALEVSVQELQSRLTNVESSHIGTSSAYQKSNHVDSNSIEVAILKGEREKRLENMLQKTKKDKDKAVRFIIDMIGKERISHFLNQHAGEADILDRLMTSFAHLRLDGPHNNSSPTKNKRSGATQKSKSATKAGQTTPSHLSQTNPEQLKLQRSRIDEYFRSTLNKRDL